MSPAVENFPTTHGNTLLEVPVDAHAYPAATQAVLPALYLPGSHCEHVVAVTTPVLQEDSELWSSGAITLLSGNTSAVRT